MTKKAKKCNIPYSTTGKWIVTNSVEQESKLHEIHQRSKILNVPTFFQNESKCKKQEPLIRCKMALVSPETAIIDSHSFMQAMEVQSQLTQNDVLKNDGIILFNTTLIGLERIVGGFSAQITTAGHPPSRIIAPIVINAAGLHAHSVASKLLPDSELESLKIHYAKGHYFSWRTANGRVKRLIYPVPDSQVTSLGVHLTVDLEGNVKFGPDLQYTNGIDYEFTADAGDFMKAIRTYIPSLNECDLVADYVGIRPKLQGLGERFRDFHVQNHGGFVNLMGIESPGLTSSLAIGEYVHGLLYKSNF